MTDRWQQVERICQSALELGESQRRAFLDEACAGDEELRREVESLLKFESRGDQFIEEPALEVAAKMIAQEKPESLLGQQLGSYQILSLLGTGGMGVVYKARDSRLTRFVAIKVLPAQQVNDPERKRRFIQEARAASALNHPNIITIYDIGREGGIDFVVMEYVAGKTLDQRIPRKGMRLNETLKLAIQMADALAKAHSAGIIHRDLKPTNVMVTDEGLVKVLDFGLAKLTEVESDEGGAHTTQPQTETGTIIGTVSYMSPEQAEGKKVDARSDIFSFGSVLYEMTTGQRAFERESKIATLSAILRDDPKPGSQMVANIPKELERVIIRCLRKDRERRWQSMADVKVALTEIKEETEQGLEPVVPQRRKSRWIVAGALLAVVAIGAAITWQWSRSSGEYSILRMRTLPFTSYPGQEQTPAFSPDGNQVAFTWNGEKGDNYDIYVKLIDGGPPLRLTTNPADECCPAWSPDGRRIAFLRNPEVTDIIMISALGGVEHRLGQLPSFGSLSWCPDGKFLVSVDRASPQDPYSIFLLSTETGEKRRLTSPPLGSMDLMPVFSSDGKTLAFGRYKSAFVGDIYLLSVGASTPRGEPRRLTFDERRILGLDWTSHGRSLVFSSNRGGGQNLWVVPVSGGEPQRLAVGENASALSIAKHGNRLVYQQDFYDENIWRMAGPGPTWQPLTKRESVPTKLIASTKTEEDPQFSPNGKRIAFASNRSGNDEIWVCDSDGSNSVPITSLGAPSVGSPRWSPDSRQIAFDSTKEGGWDIYTVSAEGGQSRRLTTEGSSDNRPSWSRNGRWIYFGSDRSGGWQVWKIPSEGGTAVRVTRQGGREAFESADGQWLYYTKERFPVRGIWRVPVAGGEETQVLDHGLEGFWAVLDPGISLAALDPESTPVIEFLSFATRQLTTITRLPKDLKGRAVLQIPSFAVSPDGRWILLLLNDRTESDLVLVENFR